MVCGGSQGSFALQKHVRGSSQGEGEQELARPADPGGGEPRPGHTRVSPGSCTVTAFPRGQTRSPASSLSGKPLPTSAGQPPGGASAPQHAAGPWAWSCFFLRET